jgi:hypothetical protein
LRKHRNLTPALGDTCGNTATLPQALGDTCDSLATLPNAATTTLSHRSFVLFFFPPIKKLKDYGKEYC